MNHRETSDVRRKTNSVHNRKLSCSDSEPVRPGFHFLRLTSHVLLLTLVSACVYHLSGTEASLPPDARTISVSTLGNNTFEPGIEAIMTQHLREEILSSHRFKLSASATGADLVLSGNIVNFELIPLSFDRDSSTVVEYRVRINVDARLEEPSSHELIWDDSMIETTADYLVSADNSAARVAKDRAVAEASRNLAQDLVRRVLEGSRR